MKKDLIYAVSYDKLWNTAKAPPWFNKKLKSFCTRKIRATKDKRFTPYKEVIQAVFELVKTLAL